MSEWRKKLSVHPAADCLPMMSAPEIKALAADIKANGLLNKIDLVVQPHNEDDMLLDGRNRMEAMELLGKKLFSPKGELLPEFRGREIVIDDEDAIKHVTSANIARRHLTNEQKREAVTKLLKSNPHYTDGRIAKHIGVNQSTVSRKRAEMENNAELNSVPVKERARADGKAPSGGRPKKAEKATPVAAKDQAKAAAKMAENGWLNRAALAAQGAKYDSLTKAPKTKKHRALVVAAIKNWTAVLKAIDSN